jgi:hypothetical protein
MRLAAVWCPVPGLSPRKAETVQSGYERNDALVLLKGMLWGLAAMAVGLLVAAVLI